MFLYTFDKNKKDELVKKDFRLICEQYRGDCFVYTFEFKPSFFALFKEEDRMDIFISNKITMA